MSEQELISVEKTVTCVARFTAENENGTKFWITVEDDAGERTDVPGAKAYETFPVGAGLIYTQTLTYSTDVDEPDYGVDPK